MGISSFLQCARRITVQPIRNTTANCKARLRFAYCCSGLCLRKRPSFQEQRTHPTIFIGRSSLKANPRAIAINLNYYEHQVGFIDTYDESPRVERSMYVGLYRCLIQKPRLGRGQRDGSGITRCLGLVLERELCPFIGHKMSPISTVNRKEAASLLSLKGSLRVHSLENYWSGYISRNPRLPQLCILFLQRNEIPSWTSKQRTCSIWRNKGRRRKNCYTIIRVVKEVSKR